MSAKSTSNSTKTQSEQPSPFVNYDLTNEDKAALKASNPTWAQVSKEMSQLVQEGYKISINWDNYSECLAAFLIGTKTTANDGFILTSRANDPLKLLASLIFKHKAVFDGVWHNRVLQSKPSDDF